MISEPGERLDDILAVRGWRSYLERGIVLGTAPTLKGALHILSSGAVSQSTQGYVPR